MTRHIQDPRETLYAEALCGDSPMLTGGTGTTGGADCLRCIALLHRTHPQPVLMEEGPATIRPMPPSPETSRRLWSMYCDECGIEEGMAESPHEPWLIQRVYRHNHANHRTPQPTEGES